MHFEMPELPIRNFKDFAKHYLMIVLSILTAQGLEAWLLSAHHHRAAVEASTRIDAEIQANLGEIRTTLGQDTRQMQVLAGIRENLIEDLKANTPEATIVQHILAQTKAANFNLNLRWPTLRHEAWDVAVASQAASWIDNRRLYGYSAAYASQRDSPTFLTFNLALVMNGPQMIDTMTDLQTGTVRPREFLHVVSQMTTMLGQARDNLAELGKRLDAALPSSASAGLGHGQTVPTSSGAGTGR